MDKAKESTWKIEAEIQIPKSVQLSIASAQHGHFFILISISIVNLETPKFELSE